jgi:hypothetical protein
MALDKFTGQFVPKFILYVEKWECISPGVECLGREANRSSPSSAEVKNVWRYTSIRNTSPWCGD